MNIFVFFILTIFAASNRNLLFFCLTGKVVLPEVGCTIFYYIMISYKKNSHKKANADKKIIFNTTAGFAESGINFDENYLFTGNRILCKAILFPGGKWLGHRALVEFVRQSVPFTLKTACYAMESDKLDEETRWYYYNLEGICMHMLYVSALLEGQTHPEAKEFVIDFVEKFDFGIEGREIETFLCSNMFAV